MKFAALAPAVALAALVSCAKSDGGSDTTRSTTSPADSSFTTLARAIIDDHLSRYPSTAVDLGVHRWDDKVEDVSEAAVHAETQALTGFRTKLAAVDTAGLSITNRADRE